MSAWFHSIKKGVRFASICASPDSKRSYACTPLPVKHCEVVGSTTVPAAAMSRKELSQASQQGPGDTAGSQAVAKKILMTYM